MKYQLPKEFATKWVAALRSGEYKQGKNKLLREDCFCCLGVACVINGVSNNDINVQNYPTDKWLPKGIMVSPSEDENEAMFLVVSKLNDEAGLSFPEIAEWIEQNVSFV